MSNLQIVRRFKFSQFDTGWAVVDDDGEVQAFFDDVEGAPDAALAAAKEWLQP
jgi:pterin-4a-carbinolamine dehydratase